MNLMEKIFKGFGKPRKSNGVDLQLEGFESLACEISENAELKKFLAILKNKMVVMRTHKVGTGWEIFTADMRWDLLNPGKPYLVPIEVILSDKRGTIDQMLQQMIWCVYDIRSNQLTTVVGTGDVGMAVTCDLQKKDYVNTEADISTALDRFQQFAAYRVVQHMAENNESVTETHVDGCRKHIASVLEMDAKTLALI